MLENIKKENETFTTKTKWTNEIEEKVKEYKYAKQVYLDSDNAEDIELITKIQDVLDNQNINDNIEFDKILETNKVFKLQEDVEFTIRRIQYYFKEEKIKINDCAILFLFHEENEFFKMIKARN